MAEPGHFPTTSPDNKSQKVADNFEPIDVEGQKETGIWVHHPGSEVSEEWEPRKGKKSKQAETEILSQDTPRSSKQSSLNGENSSDDENKEGQKTKKGNIIQRGLHKIFHRHHSNVEDPSNSFGKTVSSSPHANVKPVHVKRVGLNLVMGDAAVSEQPVAKTPKAGEGSSNEGSGTENQGNIKDKAKNLLKNAGKRSARRLKQALSRKGSGKFDEKSEEGGEGLSDSTDDEDSISSSVYDPSSMNKIRISSSFISRVDDDVAGAPEEHIVHDVSTEPTTTKSDGPDGENDVLTRSSEGNGEIPFEESLKPESLQGKVDGEKIVEA